MVAIPQVGRLAMLNRQIFIDVSEAFVLSGFSAAARREYPA
jgi:hypothetical protein